VYCANCGDKGHIVKECIGPITSFGILAFKLINDSNEEKDDLNNNLKDILKTVSSPRAQHGYNMYPKIKFLMIQRKDTMGYIDFIRGKYPDNNEEAKMKLLNVCLHEMTYQEKCNLLTKSFDELWNDLWINHESKTFKNEYLHAKSKFQRLDVKTLVENSHTKYDFQEFGFPKGRRNMREQNITCAEREFFEETGYTKNHYDFIKNYPTIYEEFIGTNGVRYRHIYYLAETSIDKLPDNDNNNEIGRMEFFTYNDGHETLREYHIEKRQIITSVFYYYLENILNMFKANELQISF
jgi:ADP-ribose pyrophosphatase YjhB (NUDIX family)